MEFWVVEYSQGLYPAFGFACVFWQAIGVDGDARSKKILKALAALSHKLMLGNPMDEEDEATVVRRFTTAYRIATILTNKDRYVHMHMPWFF